MPWWRQFRDIQYLLKKFDICKSLSKKFDIFDNIVFRDARIFFQHQAEFGPASPHAGVELLRQIFLQCISWVWENTINPVLEYMTHTLTKAAAMLVNITLYYHYLSFLFIINFTSDILILKKN